MPPDYPDMTNTRNPEEDSGYNAAVEDFRDEEYPMLKDATYLDHAGTTPYPKSLIDQFAQTLTTNLFGNPHSASPSSQLSSSRLDDVRLRVLGFFGADPADFDVVFVANATAGVKLVVEALRTVPGGFDYAYHQASHTSLVGVREEARRSVCVGDEQVHEWLAGGRGLFRGRDDRNGEADTVLFSYPAQSNMDGRRLPLRWADDVRERERASGRKHVYTLLDAASLVATSPLDLSAADTAPDFIVLSFYKIFGFPDLGALIVRRQAEPAFRSRKYFGGGTVEVVVCLREQWRASKSQFLHERLEDGTLPIHSIVALDAAFDAHERLFGSMHRVAAHTSFLSRRLRRGLGALRHYNGEFVCTIYSSDADAEKEEPGGTGPIVAFNVRNHLGAWIGLSEFDKLATLRKFHVRTGGVCNPGGIAAALGLEPWEIRHNFSAGLRCGTDDYGGGYGGDIMAGKPTGVIRASLGAMSTVTDVDGFVAFVAEFFCEQAVSLTPPPVLDRVDALSLPQESGSGADSGLYVHSIWVYPIKSCGGFEIPRTAEWEVRPEGLAWDREWCLVHRGSGQALSQKRHPKMALIRPLLDFDKGRLLVTFAGRNAGHLPEKEIAIPLSKDPSLFQPSSSSSSPSPLRVVPQRVCGDEISAQTYVSAAINDFFSDALGVPCLLVRFPPGGHGKSMRHAKAHLQKHQISPSSKRSARGVVAAPPPPPPPPLPGAFPAALSPPSPPDSDTETRRRRILLSNESPVLAVTMASLDALNEEIRERGGKGVPPTVFRPNVIIGSSPSSCDGHGDDRQHPIPYAEDDWSTLQIGQQQFQMLGSCRRCHMVCINQQTGEKSDEPFVTLSKTRRFDGKVFFGVHMGHAPSLPYSQSQPQPVTRRAQYPTIRVGDAVQPDLEHDPL